jgi:hypothetical protein
VAVFDCKLENKLKSMRYLKPPIGSDAAAMACGVDVHQPRAAHNP